MKPKHALRCLGHPVLFAPDGDPIRIRTKKHLALLVYLAVEQRRSHRRDDLAEFLWPKATIEEARHSLSTALSLFRSRLGRDALEGSREKITLKAGRVALDLDHLLAGDILGDAYTPPLDVAAFLDGFDIPDAPEFALWKDRQQARLLPAIKQALVMLMDRCRRTGEFQQIEDLADRMLALDDLSEEAIRGKMEARALFGDRIAALRVFEEWKAKLAEELQAVPSEALQGMARRLRTSWWCGTTKPQGGPVPRKQWQDRPFVNRNREYQILYEGWERTRNNAVSHMLLLGDSGVGKTTLVQRLMAATALEGAAVSRTQCHDIEREIPYSMISALVTDLLEHTGAPTTRPEALAELAMTFPQVRRRFPSIPAINEDSQGETARIRLTEAFIELLVAIGEEQPVLLIIDDLHFADDASLAVLHLAIRRIPEKPVMIILLTRQGEMLHSPHAIRLRTSATILGIRDLEIQPLTEDDSRTLLRSLISADERQPDESTRRSLLRAANGYPMVLELLVQDWQAQGNQALALAINSMTKYVHNDGVAAETYRKILQHVVISLRPAAKKVLSLAAVLGHRLNDLDMYQLVGFDFGEASNAIAELVNYCLLSDNGQKLEFRNELIRGAAYLAVPSPARAKLHGQIADRLIQVSGDKKDILGLEIAWHCIRAGRMSEAAPYLLRGARESLNKGAAHAAEHALVTALANLEDSNRTDALILLIEALHEQSKWQESLTWLATITTEDVPDLRTIFTLYANHFLGNNTTHTTRGGMHTLIGIIRTSPLPATRAKAARVASRFLPELRDEASAATLLEHVEAIPTSELSEQESIELSVAKSLCFYHKRESEASMATLIRVVDQLHDTGNVGSTLGSSTMGLGCIKCQHGNYLEALTDFQRAHEIAGRIGNDVLQNNAAAQIALCYCRLGRYDDLLKWTTKTSEIAESTFLSYNDVQIIYYSGLAHAFRGEAEQAINAIMIVENRIPTSLPDWLFQTWHFFKADILFAVGQRPTALDAARQGLGYPNAVLHCRFFAGGFARWLAHTADSSTTRIVAKRRLAELTADISSLDALDQVEILCADLVLNCEEMDKGMKLERQKLVKQKLDDLPFSVSDQLKTLGMLYP